MSTSRARKGRREDARHEQQIGSAVVPLGIAGPLLIKGDYAKGEFFILLATSEAALIARINCGIKALNKSGGADVLITRRLRKR